MTANNFSYIDQAIDELDKLNKVPTTSGVLRKLSLFNDTKTDESDYNTKLDEIIVDKYVTEEIWNHVICFWQDFGEAESKCFRALIVRGIPDHFRRDVWLMMANIENIGELYDTYKQCLKKKYESEDEIKLDVPRTFPNVEGFCESDDRLLKSLFKVVKAYSIYDADVGYCQGVASLAGLLLMKMNERDSFAMLVTLMFKYGLRKLYKPEMSQFKVVVHQFDGILKRTLPNICNYFKLLEFSTSIICSHFLTLACNILPLAVVFNVIDLVLLDGFKIVPKVFLAILKLNEGKLLHFRMEQLLAFFHHDLKEIYSDGAKELILEASRITFDRKLLNKLEREQRVKEYRRQKSIDATENLKDEIIDLKERIDLLEKENCTLAEKLLCMQTESTTLRDINEGLEEQNRVLKMSIRAQSMVEDNVKKWCNYPHTQNIPVATQGSHPNSDSASSSTEAAKFENAQITARSDRSNQVVSADSRGAVSTNEETSIECGHEIAQQNMELQVLLERTHKEMTSLRQKYVRLQNASNNMAEHITTLEYSLSDGKYELCQPSDYNLEIGNTPGLPGAETATTPTSGKGSRWGFMSMLGNYLT